MTKEEQAKVRKDRKTMLSVPIFYPVPVSDRDRQDPPVLGVLSADTNASLADMMWIGDDDTLGEGLKRAITIGVEWSGILSRVLR
jgi:hypothetical protein